MKENKKVEMTEISVEKLACMEAEMEAMRLTIRNQEYDMEERCKELAETKDTLSEMVKRLGETRDLLHSSLQLQSTYLNISEGVVDGVRKFLYKFLTKHNREAVDRSLQFHKAEGQVKLIIAVLDYLLFGTRLKTADQVLQTHFNVICTRLDIDAITLPSHSLMVKLVKRYGLFETIQAEMSGKDVAEDETEEGETEVDELFEAELADLDAMDEELALMYKDRG